MDVLEGDAQARSMADAVARRSYGKLVAFLASRMRDVAQAEDALAEAFASALADWPLKGCPSNPEAWLMTVARRKLIDVARRRRTGDAATANLQLLTEGFAAAEEAAEIPDQRLSLMFACAHPAIETGVHAPLILQVVLGSMRKPSHRRSSCRPQRWQAACARERQDPPSCDPVRHTRARGASRAAGLRARRDLCGLRRRLERSWGN